MRCIKTSIKKGGNHACLTAIGYGKQSNFNANFTKTCKGGGGIEKILQENKVCF